MGMVYKRLGALRPANTNEAELYLVPADTEAVVTITICNQTGGALTYRVAHTDASGAATSEDWIAYDVAISPNSTHQITGRCMAAANSIRVRASAADSISFQADGVEIS